MIDITAELDLMRAVVGSLIVKPTVTSDVLFQAADAIREIALDQSRGLKREDVAELLALANKLSDAAAVRAR